MDLEIDECVHCGRPIYKDPDAVLHIWKHVDSGAYLCWPPRVPQTQAIPKEET